MTIILRMQQLPWSATSMDIRRYFGGLTIPDGGVHIVGGENGDVFIAFSSDEDARRAMRTQIRPLCGNKVSLMLSSKNEMQEVIARNRAVSQTKSDPFQEESPSQSPAPASQALMTPGGDPSLDKTREYGDAPKGQTPRDNFDPKQPNQPLLPSEGSYMASTPPSQRPGEGKSLLGLPSYMNQPSDQMQGRKPPGYNSEPGSDFNGRRDQMYPPGRMPGDTENRPLLDMPPSSDPGSQGPFDEDPFRNPDFQMNMRFQGPSDMDSRVSSSRRPPLLQHDPGRKDGGPYPYGPYGELQGRDALPDEHPNKRFKSGPEQKGQMPAYPRGPMLGHPGDEMLEKQNDRKRGFDDGSQWTKSGKDLNQGPTGVEGSNMDDLRMGSGPMYGNANRFSQMDRGPKMGVEGGRRPDDPFGLNDPFDDSRGSSVSRDSKGDKGGFDQRGPGKQMESDRFGRTGGWDQHLDDRMPLNQRGPSLLDPEQRAPEEYRGFGNEQGMSEPRGPRDGMNTDQRRRFGEHMDPREPMDYGRNIEDERRGVGSHMGPGGRMDEFGDADGRDRMGPGNRMGFNDRRGLADHDRRGPGNRMGSEDRSRFGNQDDYFGRGGQRGPGDSAGNQMGTRDRFSPGVGTHSDDRFNPNDRFGPGERHGQGDFLNAERQMVKDEGRHRGGGHFGPEGRFGHSDPQGLQGFNETPEGMGPGSGFDPRGRGPRDNEWRPREGGRPSLLDRDGRLQQEGYLASGGPTRSRGFQDSGPGDRQSPDSRSGPRGMMNDPGRFQWDPSVRDERMVQKDDIAFMEVIGPGGLRRRPSRFDLPEPGIPAPDGPQHRDSDMRRDPRSQQEHHQDIPKGLSFPHGDTSRNPEGKKRPAGSCCVRMSGMPYNVTAPEIHEFFDGLRIAENGIRLVLDSSRNKPNGHAYVKFLTPDDATKALKLSLTYLGKRYVELKPCRESEWESFKSLSIPPPEYPPKADKRHRSRSRSRSPIRSTSVEVKNLPLQTESHDIKDFFGCNLADDKIYIVQGDNASTCVAYVEFPDQQSCERAVRKNDHYMGRHTIEVKLIFKEIMNARVAENKKRLQEKQGAGRSSSSNRDPSSSRDSNSRNAGSRASSSKDTSKDAKSSSSKDRSSSSRESVSRSSRDQDSRQSSRRVSDAQRSDDQKDSKSRDRDSRQTSSRTKDQPKDAGSQQADPQSRHGVSSPSVKKGNESKDQDARRSTVKSGPTDSKRQESHSENTKPGSHKESPGHSYESRQQPRDAAPRGSDPRTSDPRTSDPRTSDPRTSDPRTSDPRISDSRGSDPRISDPRISDPRGSDPRVSDPRVSDPRVSDPRVSDPRVSDPRVSDPRVSDPRVSSENPAFPEEKRSLNHDEKSCISMRNMPYNTTDDEIHKFFENMKLQPLMVHFLINPDGRPNGQAYVEFQNSADAQEAVSHANTFIRDRRILMSILNRSTMMNNLAQGKPPQPPQQGLLGSPRPPLFLHPPGNRPPMDHRPPLIGNTPPPFGMRNNAARMRGPRPHPPIDVLINRRCVIEACNLPFDIPIPAIIDLFSNYNVVPESVRLKTNEQGRFSGEAMVALRSPEDANQALTDLDSSLLGGRVVRMHLMKPM